MGKVIKKGTIDLGDASSDGGRIEMTTNRKVISGRKFDAQAEAQSIKEQAESQAAQIIEAAQAQAQEVLAQAQTEAQQLREQASTQGYEEGRQQGVGELTEAVATSSRQMQEFQAEVIPQLKDLSVAIAKKILGKELEFHPDAVVDIVKQALSEKARTRREILLRVHPDDLQMLRDARGDLLEVLSRCKEIAIREDPEVAPHGVIIETDAGVIDAQLESQLAIFERVLKNA